MLVFDASTLILVASIEILDRFIDARQYSDHEIAKLMRDMEIDIAVDRSGFAGARPRIFALRPAPIQVNYLAYPGTSGADHMGIAPRWTYRPPLRVSRDQTSVLKRA